MTTVLFWSSVIVVVYAYIGYPCALAGLARLRNRPIRKRDITPPVTLIITAHNEEEAIGEKIENALAQDYPSDLLEIIVASDCSTDGTDAIARQYDDRIRLVRASERRGKEAAQALAIAASSGEILVFTDVATAAAPDCISKMVRNFADPFVGCVSSVDRFVERDGRVSGEGAYVRYEMRLRELESGINSLIGLSGSLFAVRREICREWSIDCQSDFRTLLRAVELGFRGVVEPEAIGYYRNLVDGRHEAQRKARTVVRGLAVLFSNLHMLNPARHGLFTWQLASHKLCRWLVPFAMSTAAATNAALAATSTVYLILFGLQVGFYLTAITGLLTRAAALRIPAFLLASNAAILIAWVRFACGERITFWTPSERPATLPRISSPHTS
jgi:hypothetical protein